MSTDIDGKGIGVHNLDSALVKNEEPGLNILPAAILAANIFNSTNELSNYDIHLNIMNTQVRCKAISALSMEQAKTLSGTFGSYSDEIYELVYNSVEFLDPAKAKIHDVVSFKRRISEADFNMLLFGLLNASFETLKTSTFRCGNQKCTNPDEEKKFNVDIKIQDINLTQDNHYVASNEDYQDDIFILDLGMAKINFKFDNIADRQELLNSKSNDEIRDSLLTNGSLLSRDELKSLVIHSIEINDPSKEQLIVLTTRSDISIFFGQLTLTAKDQVETAVRPFIDHIVGFSPVYSSQIECPHCKHSMKWEDFDPMVEFFLKLSAIYE